MRRLGVIVVVCALAACVQQSPRPTATLPADPAARLSAVRAREEQIRSLRARFTSVTRLPSGERSADGILLVAKPDRFRLRLMLPFGITVFDLVSIGDTTWIALPLSGGMSDDGDHSFAVFSREDLGAAFLRGPYAFPGSCVAAAAQRDEVVAQCSVEGSLRRTLRINADGIVEETSYENGEPRLRIAYADYRDVGGVAVPFHITLEYPRRHQSVDITIDQYDVNPSFADSAFVPPADATPRRS